jgi:hypothetical protein
METAARLFSFSRSNALIFSLGHATGHGCNFGHFRTAPSRRAMFSTVRLPARYRHAGLTLPTGAFQGVHLLADAIFYLNSNDPVHREKHFNDIRAGCKIYAAYSVIFGRASTSRFIFPDGWSSERFLAMHSDRELLLASWVLSDVCRLLSQRIAWCAADDAGLDYESYLASRGPRFILRILSFPPFMEYFDWEGKTLDDAIAQESPHLQALLRTNNETARWRDEGWMLYDIDGEWRKRKGEHAMIFDQERCPWWPDWSK